MRDKQVATEYTIRTYGELDTSNWSCDLTIEIDKKFVKEPNESEVYLGITFTNLSRFELVRLKQEIQKLFPD